MTADRVKAWSPKQQWKAYILNHKQESERTYWEWCEVFETSKLAPCYNALPLEKSQILMLSKECLPSNGDQEFTCSRLWRAFHSEHHRLTAWNDFLALVPWITFEAGCLLLLKETQKCLGSLLQKKSVVWWDSSLRTPYILSQYRSSLSLMTPLSLAIAASLSTQAATLTLRLPTSNRIDH